MWFRRLLLPCLFLALWCSAQGQTPNLVLQDGDFASSDWVSSKLVDTVNTGSFTASTEKAGGNPGAYRHAILTMQGGTLTVTHLPLGGTKLAYSPKEQGAIQSISYSYDVKVLNGVIGPTYQLILYQNGSTYAEPGHTASTGITAWQTVPVTFRYSNLYFTKIDGPGPMHPDFSDAGGTIYFGYLTTNTITQSTCSTPPYCYTVGHEPNSQAQTILDTGLDNLTVNLFFTGLPGVACEVTPRNKFLPFHRPECHILDPDHHPNHLLSVLVTSNGAPAPGAQVTVTTQTPSLSLAPKVPVSLSTTTLTSDSNGEVKLYYSPPAPQAFDETDFTATGSLGGQFFACNSSAIVGVGALSGPLGEFFTSSISSPQQSAQALRHLLESNRPLLAHVPRRPKYRATLKKLMRSTDGSWSASELKNLVEIAGRVEDYASTVTRKKLDRITDELDRQRQVAELERQQREARRLQASSPAEQHHGASVGRQIPAPRIAAGYGRVALPFEPNRGQVAPKIRYLARGRRFNLYLSQREAILASSMPSFAARPPDPLRIRFARANPSPRMTPLEKLPGKSHYITGNSPSRWHTGIPNYGRVKYEQIYPGVDLVFYGHQQELEFDLVLRPGAQPNQIALDFSGLKQVEPDGSGGLILRHSTGRLRLAKPLIYQEDGQEAGPNDGPEDGQGRHIIDGRYVVTNGNRVSFETAPYDPRRTLVIDPIVSWATYLGGTDYDTGMAVAADTQGNLYLAGSTASANYPLAKPLQETLTLGAKLNVDAFVTKLDPTGTQILYSTYIGGSGADSAMGVAVDGTGNAYVAGTTMSHDFPLVNPIQNTFGGGEVRFPTDAFVFKLNSAGSALIFSTYLGGSGDDVAKSIAVDLSGNVYVAGRSDSANFPFKNALQANLQGNSDAFVTELNSTGTTLVFSTLLGGHGAELANAIAVDASGNVYVAGYTDSSDFPLRNAFQLHNRGSADAFVTKLSAGGSSLIYSTYLGGESDDYAMGLALDAQGNAYVTGVTSSSSFPLQKALQPAFAAANLLGTDAFVTKLDPTGSNLVYSTYLGGGGIDVAFGIAVGVDGSAFVVGETNSTDFPSSNSLQAEGGKDDGFVAKLKPDGSGLAYSTVLGGSGQDSISGAALDGQGNLYLAGSSFSADFPVTYGSYQTGNHGDMDALALRITDGTASSAVTTVSAASFQLGAASGSMVTGFGANLADTLIQATSLPLPIMLGTTSVSVKDSMGSVQPAPLVYVAEKQVTFLIPQTSANGLALVTVTKGGQPVATGTVRIDTVAPALFSANSSGKGVAAAFAETVAPDGKQSTQPVFQCGSAPGSCVPSLLDVSAGRVYLSLYGTGIQGRSSLSQVTAQIGGVSVPVLFAGAQGSFPGEDQVNIGPLPAALSGRGEVNIELTVDGVAANTLTIGIK